MALKKPKHSSMGNSGFGYHFNALSGQSDELANAYQLIFTTAKKLQLRTILETWVPLLRKFVRHARLFNPAVTAYHSP
jgi:hypothetical protein